MSVSDRLIVAGFALLFVAMLFLVLAAGPVR